MKHLNDLSMFADRVTRKVRSALFQPTLTITNHRFELVRLGSEYGGWSVANTECLRNSTIVSCGLGEDASFDVEFANRFDATVIIVDPTPRAIEHYESMMTRAGMRASAKYVSGGRQPTEAYDLENLGSRRLRLVRKAIWSEAGTVKFFRPISNDHVSHSIVNIQRGFRESSEASEYIEVAAITLMQLITEVDVHTLPLLKLDIEGAEIEVIESLLDAEIYVPQLLVEYDELLVPSRISKNRVTRVHNRLLSCGYRLICREGPGNCVYIRAP